MMVNQEKRKAAIVRRIEAALSSVPIENRDIDPVSLFRALEAFWNSQAKDTGAFLSHVDFTFGIIDLIKESISKVAQTDRSGEQLGTFLGKDLLATTSSSICEFLESIPRKYQVFFELPQLRQIEVGQIFISNEMRIIKVCEEVSQSTPRESNRPSFTTGLRGGTYLVVQVRGYSRGDFSSSAASSAISKLKQLICLGQFESQIELEPLYYPIGNPPDGKMYIQEIINPEVITKIELDEEWKNLIGQINYKGPKSFNLNPEEVVNDVMALLPNIQSRESVSTFKLPSRGRALLEASDEDKDYGPIARALEWYFDGVFMHNHESGMALLKIAMGMEAALGAASKRSSVVQEIADRCAFRIASTNSQREKIIEEMKKFYDHRSDVAHGRVRRLHNKDIDWLYWGQETLKKLLKRELLNF